MGNNLSGQQRGILEERLKTVDKELTKKGLPAGYRRAEFDAVRCSSSLDTTSFMAGGVDTGAGATASAGAYGCAPVAAAAPSAGYGSAAGGYGANRARGDTSILAGVSGVPGAAGTYGNSSSGAYGAAGAGVASSQSAMPGLSSTAGLISLGSSVAAPSDGDRGMSRQASLMHTTEYAAMGGQSAMLMTAPGQSSAAAAPAPQLAAAPVSAQQQQQLALQAAAVVSRAAAPMGLHLQPLQSFTNTQELQAEFAKCINVLQHGHVDDVIEVMKLLCYEMMDLQRNQAAAAAGAAGAGSPQADAVWQLLVQQADTLVQLLTMQTQLVS